MQFVGTICFGHLTSLPVQVKGQFSLGIKNASYFRTVCKFLRRLAVETPWFTHSRKFQALPLSIKIMVKVF
jgi:hypothetical protein